MEFYLGTMIRQVDSSLLDEWEKMRDPNFLRAETKEVRPPGAEAAEQDITRDTKAFTAAIRNRIFNFLRGLVIGDFDPAIAHLASPDDPDGQPWTAARLRQALEAYHAEHERICLDPERPQLAPHLHRAIGGQKDLARATNAGGPAGPQRLGGRVRGGLGGVAKTNRAFPAPAADWKFDVTAPSSSGCTQQDYDFSRQQREIRFAFTTTDGVKEMRHDITGA